MRTTSNDNYSVQTNKKILHPEIDPLVEEEIKVRTRGNCNYRNNYGHNYRKRSRGRWNNHRLGDRSNNYLNNNR